ncbi:ATP-dependent helicase fft2 [Fusarium oxysporum f. sp. albedinis]|nr:ATP-dependent helicase fft2 [Fusarium oxysporum f. sp. albedinis]
MGELSEAPATPGRCSSSSTSTCTMDVKNIEKGENTENIPQKASIQLSNLDLLSQIYMPGVSNRATDPGMHVPGSLLRQWNAEDGIADLSSNRSQQGVTGGLWDAIKEFLCTIKGYNIQLLRLYWKAVKPVFDYSSPYWRATDRDSDGWTDLASTCLALPLIFGLLVILVWGMELTAITMKCREEDWDCLVDEALAMFRRSLTGVYMDD